MPSALHDDILVRPLTPADAGAYTRLRLEMLHDSPWAFGSSPEDDVALDAAHIAEQLAHPGFAIVGAFHEHSDPPLVGAVGIIRHRKRKTAHSADIYGVYVSPPVRGQGVAARMLDLALQLARTWPGITSARLSASVRSGEAIRLYQRLGFKPWGTEPAAIMIDGVPHDEVHMAVFFDEVR